MDLGCGQSGDPQVVFEQIERGLQVVGLAESASAELGVEVADRELFELVPT